MCSPTWTYSTMVVVSFSAWSLVRGRSIQEASKRAGPMNKGKHYVAIGDGAYSRAGYDLLPNEQNTSVDWRGDHYDQDRLPSPSSRGNILEASATIALITEPQQTVWLRDLLLKTFEIDHGQEAIDLLKASHDWLGEPFTAATHPQLFPVRTPYYPMKKLSRFRRC